MAISIVKDPRFYRINPMTRNDDDEEESAGQRTTKNQPGFNYFRSRIPKQSRKPIYYLAYSICNHNGRAWDNEADALEGLGYERSHTNGFPCPIRGIVVVNKRGRSWLHKRKNRPSHHSNRKPRRR